jgi:hypothetical protein
MIPLKSPSGSPANSKPRTHVAVSKAAALNIRTAANQAGITQRCLLDAVLEDEPRLKQIALALRGSVSGVELAE